jgi:Transposase DDE domain group 1
MTTECNQFVFGFHPQKRREIRAQFDGGAITSDGGGLLLREVEKRVGILRQFAACFTDYRNPDLIEHQVAEMVAQRVAGSSCCVRDCGPRTSMRRQEALRSCSALWHRFVPRGRRCAWWCVGILDFAARS